MPIWQPPSAPTFTHEAPPIRRIFALLLPAVLTALVIYQLKFAPTPVTAHPVARGEIVGGVMGTGTLEARVKTTLGLARGPGRFSGRYYVGGECLAIAIAAAGRDLRRGLRRHPWQAPHSEPAATGVTWRVRPLARKSGDSP